MSPQETSGKAQSHPDPAGLLQEARSLLEVEDTALPGRPDRDRMVARRPRLGPPRLVAAEERSRLLATHGTLARPHAPLRRPVRGLPRPLPSRERGRLGGEARRRREVRATPVAGSAIRDPGPSCERGPGFRAGLRRLSSRPPRARGVAGRGLRHAMHRLPRIAGRTYESGGSRHYAAKVTRFDIDHPAFRPTRTPAKDPGTIKFSHALHCPRDSIPSRAASRS